MPLASSWKTPSENAPRIIAVDDPHEPRLLGDAATDPAPDAGLVALRVAEVRDERPEHPAAEDHEQGRQQDHHHEQGHDDACRGHRTEAAGRVHLGEHQAQQADDDGRATGDDGRPGAVQRVRHRLVAILVVPQLLAVAGHQQQRVVDAGTQRQDAEDRRALAVDGEPEALGQHVDEALGGQTLATPQINGISHSTGLR